MGTFYCRRGRVSAFWTGKKVGLRFEIQGRSIVGNGGEIYEKTVPLWKLFYVARKREYYVKKVFGFS